MNEILEKEVRIQKIIDLPKKDESGGHPYIIELENEAVTKEVLRRKSNFFKLNKSNVSLNAARTKCKRDMERSVNKKENDYQSSKESGKNSVVGPRNLYDSSK